MVLLPYAIVLGVRCHSRPLSRRYSWYTLRVGHYPTENANMDSYRLKVRLGVSEFEAEGPEAAVKEQFAAWLAAVNATPAAKADTSEDRPRRTDEAGNASDAPPPSKGLIDRLFRQDKAGVVSLRKMPNGASVADAIMLILYGYHVLSEEQGILGGRIRIGLKDSGFSGVERLDRGTGLDPNLVTYDGKKSGRRYTLTNPGLTRAEELVRAAFS